MTMQFPVADQTRVNEPLLRSRAEWVSPGYDDEIFTEGRHPMAPGSPPSRWFADPPPADGAKVVITDTDHYAPGQGDALWAWKSFLRGHHPILMDFGLIAGLRPGAAEPQAGVPPFEFYEPARWAMGDTRRYAERIALADTAPRRESASTGFALTNPGKEYLVLEPSGSGTPFTVTVKAGRYAVEWFDVTSRRTVNADALTVERERPVEMRAPFSDGPAVLYLSRID
jgi:hypothetical protein